MEPGRTRIRAAAVLLAAFLSAAPAANAAPGTDSAALIETESGIRLSDGKTALDFQEDTGIFTVTDLAGGTVYHSCPEDRDEDDTAKGLNKFRMYSLLLVSVLDKETHETSWKASYTASVLQGGLSWERTGSGIRLLFAFPESEITVPLDLSLADGGMTAAVSYDEIRQEGGYLVESVSLLPYMGSGGARDSGYLMVPDGSGALIDFSQDKSGFRPYSQPVYGTDPAYAGDLSQSLKQSIHLPVFGIQRNGSAFLAEITEGAESAALEAFSPGMINRSGAVYATFSFLGNGLLSIGESSTGAVKETHYYDTRHPLLKRASIRYHWLPDGGGYVRMAETYRGILQKNGVGSSTADRRGVTLEIAGAAVKKESFLGFYVERKKRLTSFEAFSKRAAALELPAPIQVIYTDWTDRQLRGKPQSGAVPSSAVGSRRQLQGLTEEPAFSGVAVSFEPFYVKKSLFEFNRFSHAARRIGGEINRIYPYKRSTLYWDKSAAPTYLLKSSRWESVAGSFLKSLEKTAGKADVYSATLGNTLYSDFDRKNFVSRGGAAEKIMGILSESGRKWIFKAPNAYALPYAKSAVEAPVSSSGFDLFSRDVPFYQLAVDGLIEKTVPALNAAQDADTALLRALETGSGIQFRLADADYPELKGTALEALCYGNFALWEDRVRLLSRRFEQAVRDVGGGRITNHRNITGHVAETTFSTGKRLLVNYGAEDAAVGPVTVGAKDYTVLDH